MASAWDLDMRAFGALDSDAHADVVIVGGGLCGIWCAYNLAKGGTSVIVLEADRLGRSATLYTTAFLTCSLDTQLSELVSIFGQEQAKTIVDSHQTAIDIIEKTVQEEGIECEFMRITNTIYAHNAQKYAELEVERDWAEKFSLKTKLRKDLDIGLAHEGAWQIEDQGKYHPIKFFNGLVNAAEKLGVRLYEHTEATDIRTEDGVRITTKEGHAVTAHDVIIATYQPLDNTKTHLKKGMYTSYVYQLEIPQASIPEGLYEDMANPYHYIRIDACADKDRMIVGGEDHRSELGFMEEKSFKALEEYVQKTFPKLTYHVKSKWQGGILEPSDGIALVGRVAPHEYVAAAFSGNGMTYSAIAGKLLTDLIQGRDNPWRSAYDPTRSLGAKALALKARDYTEEFFGGAVKNLFK
jgi:glycine/D-amino acid oxidase-like deaminating enzyme